MKFYVSLYCQHCQLETITEKFVWVLLKDLYIQMYRCILIFYIQFRPNGLDASNVDLLMSINLKENIPLCSLIQKPPWGIKIIYISLP